MAISAATLVSKARTSTNGASSLNTTGTDAMSADSLALAFVVLATSDGDATTFSNPAGYGMTWEDVSSAFAATTFTVKQGTNGLKCAIFAGLTGSGDPAGQFTVDISGSTSLGWAITVIELTGDFSGATSAVEAILQVARDPSGAEESATSQTPSLASAPDSDSRCVAMFNSNQTTDHVHDGDWTVIDFGSHSTPSNELSIAWRSDAADQTVSASWSPNSVRSVGYILELAEVPTAASAVTMSVGNVNIGF